MMFITRIILCSDCFRDPGLKADAERLGFKAFGRCPNCKSRTSKKLNHDALVYLARQFFVDGTFKSSGYGGAPLVQFNPYRETEVKFADQLDADVALISKKLGIGFFHYGPNLWMLGEIEPLEKLANAATRSAVIAQIMTGYPTVILGEEQLLYRLRVNPKCPSRREEYDSPPTAVLGNGRLDSKSCPIFYSSQDIEVCIHECRVTVEDETYLATFAPSKSLKLLDLTAIIEDKSVTAFQSLDLSINFLFLAGKYSYEICRAIALAARQSGFDGIIYPSYFSMLRTGSRAFETSLGISLRRVSRLHDYERSKFVGNIALFGYPLSEKKISFVSSNRLRLKRATYEYFFGPVLPELDEVDQSPSVETASEPQS